MLKVNPHTIIATLECAKDLADGRGFAATVKPIPMAVNTTPSPYDHSFLVEFIELLIYDFYIFLDNPTETTAVEIYDLVINSLRKL